MPLAIDDVVCAALGAVDLAALLSLAVQWRGEFGSRGIAPAAAAVERLRRRCANAAATVAPPAAPPAVPGVIQRIYSRLRPDGVIASARALLPAL